MGQTGVMSCARDIEAVQDLVAVCRRIVEALSDEVLHSRAVASTLQALRKWRW
jgi:hypothetical protein